MTTVTSTDADGDTRTYSLSDGADQAKFSINSSSGALTFTSAPDYESPTDTGSNNTYVVEVTSSDGNGGTDTQTLTVTVTDVSSVPATANTASTADNPDPPARRPVTAAATASPTAAKTQNTAMWTVTLPVYAARRSRRR